jgi:hypothetical protein
MLLFAAMAESRHPHPKFKSYAESEPIPPVDPEDIKRMYEYERTHNKVNANGCQWLHGLNAMLSPEAEFSDVSSRYRMIETLIHYNDGQSFTFAASEQLPRLNQLLHGPRWRERTAIDDATLTIRPLVKVQNGGRAQPPKMLGDLLEVLPAEHLVRLTESATPRHGERF